MIKVLLVDDKPLIRRGLRDLLKFELGLEIVAEAGDGLEAIQLVQLCQPDLVILDLEMPGMNGLTALNQLHTYHPDCAVIVLSIRDDPQIRQRVLEAGASAFVTKHKFEELLEAIQQVTRQHNNYISARPVSHP